MLRFAVRVKIGSVFGAALIPLMLISLGCAHKKGLVGTWESAAPANGSAATMTFNADHTMSFIATNGPKQAPYKLEGQGTWSMNGDSLTVVPLSMQLANVAEKQRAKLQPYLNAQLKVPQTATVVWKGSDEFVQTKSSVVQDFMRKE